MRLLPELTGHRVHCFLLILKLELGLFGMFFSTSPQRESIRLHSALNYLGLVVVDSFVCRDTRTDSLYEK